MDMELSLLARILWRWKWLIIACVLTATTAVWLGLSNAVPVYHASTVLSFGTPDRPDVELIDRYKFVDSRAEVVLAINNFITIAQQPNVYEQTREALNLEEADANYKVSVDSSSDADFVEISLEAESAILAANIVNTHTRFAIDEFGRSRSQSTVSNKETFDEQLLKAQSDLGVAERSFMDFREANGITFLETDINVVESGLIQLMSEQTKLVARDPVGQSPQVIQLETRIAEQRARLEALSQLEPEYTTLETIVTSKRDDYQLLLSKSSEAETSADIAQRANFVQISTPAEVPPAPVDKATRLLLLAVLGSLGMGILLSFILEYLTGAPLAQEYKVAREVRAILSDEQLIGSRALLKQLQERSSASRDSFDLTQADSRELMMQEREIELQRRQADVS